MTPGIINGNTELIAHIGFPTHSFKAPMIYNPWFDEAGVNARVMPMGCKPDDFAALFKSLFTLTNMRGAFITMPRQSRHAGLARRSFPHRRHCRGVQRRSLRPGGSITRRHVRW